jgi:hypothetical protein
MGVIINCMLKVDLSGRWNNGTNLHGLNGPLEHGKVVA